MIYVYKMSWLLVSRLKFSWLIKALWWVPWVPKVVSDKAQLWIFSSTVLLRLIWIHIFLNKFMNSKLFKYLNIEITQFDDIPHQRWSNINYKLKFTIFEDSETISCERQRGAGNESRSSLSSNVDDEIAVKEILWGDELRTLESRIVLNARLQKLKSSTKDRI